MFSVISSDISTFTVQDAIYIGLGLIAIVRLYMSGIQLKQIKAAERANMMLKLDEMLASHKEVYSKLRHHGEWTLHPDAGPETAEEWNELTVYMGLFERVNIMIDEKLVKVKHFKQLHGYRVQEIIDNPTISQQKLVDDAGDWSNFIALVGKLGLHEDREGTKKAAPVIETQSNVGERRRVF